MRVTGKHQNSASTSPTKFTTCSAGAIGVRAYRATAEFFDRRLVTSSRRQ
jgi:hypothetical protein